MNELLLVVTIAGERVAIPSAAVESVSSSARAIARTGSAKLPSSSLTVIITL